MTHDPVQDLLDYYREKLGRYVTAARVGDPDFPAFLGEVYRLGIVSRAERGAWLKLHRAVLKAIREGQGAGSA